ncbi:MAG: trans-sialidase, partial [Nitrosarchaeum sp.]|nr:trans-sialidase [Nitrosarchaeum sp.]
MSAAKKQTKQDLEDKIAELEAKLNTLATQLEAKPAEVKPAPAKPAEVKPAPAKPAEVKPAPAKPAEVKPKGTLPKGFETKPADAPKPSETNAQLPSTI